jgi:hypothetical protein
VWKQAQAKFDFQAAVFGQNVLNLKQVLAVVAGLEEPLLQACHTLPLLSGPPLQTSFTASIQQEHGIT